MLGKNIKYLRRKRKFSQEKLAKALGIKRSSLSGYETGATEPNLEILTRLSTFFEVSIDALVKHDLEGLDQQAIRNKDLSSIKSANLRILATTVDKQEKENIEFVPGKAKAGYLHGYADAAFIQALPKFNVPNLPVGTYRAFELEGDSMLPMPGGSVIIGKYVEHWQHFKDGRTYVLVTESEGVVYKRIQNRVAQDHTLVLLSDNPLYKPYPIKIQQVREAWEYYAHIGFDHPEADFSFEKLMLSIHHLHEEVKALRKIKAQQ